MTFDEKFIQEIRAITDPRELLREIVENEQFLGYDPYYADFRRAFMETAKKLSEG